MSCQPSWSISPSSNVLIDINMNYPPGLGKTTRRRAGSFSYQSTTDLPRGRAMSRLPFSRNRILTPPPTTKFDPFGSDDNALPTSISNTGYTHYYQYNPRSKMPTILYQQTNYSSPALSSPPATPAPTPAPQRSRVRPSSVNLSSVPLHSMPIPAKETRARLVAGILLNRIHVVGKPMRRRCEGQREYVKSGLSSCVVCVE